MKNLFQQADIVIQNACHLFILIFVHYLAHRINGRLICLMIAFLEER